MIRIYAAENYDEMSEKAARIIAAQVIVKPECVLGLATGSSPVGPYQRLVERYKARYAQSGVNLTTEQAMDEIAADFTEALTVDPSRFDTLAQEHRSVARRVLDAAGIGRLVTIR